MKKTDLFFIYVKDFIEYNRLELKSGKTIESYREGLNDFRIYICDSKHLKLEKISFNDISDDIIREYLKWIIDKGNSLSTRNIRLSTLKQYIKYCASKKMELIPLEISISKIKNKKVKSKKHNWIDKTQVKLILDQCNRNRLGNRDRFIMFFMFSTGSRLSELLSIRVKDIVLESEYPYVILSGKGNKTRVVPITIECIDNLKYYLELYHGNSNSEDYLFYTILKEKKFKMSEDNIQRIVNKYADKAREIDKTIPKMHPHLFRHSFGALMYRQGLSLAEVAKLMGNEQLSTTEIYAETDVDMINEALSKINKNTVDCTWEKLSEEDKLKVIGLKK